jgi:small conductance mechanosensitive channel
VRVDVVLTLIQAADWENRGDGSAAIAAVFAGAGPAQAAVGDDPKVQLPSRVTGRAYWGVPARRRRDAETRNPPGGSVMSTEQWAFLMERAMALGLTVLGAAVVWIVGRMLIGLVVRLVQRSMGRQHVDPTLLRYMGNIISVALNIALVVGILGYFGVETTSFAALLAACGVAIGMAWSGLLANFAAGAFLVVLRPFKAGDFVTAGGVTGTVREVGLFVTSIDTPDNVLTYVGNGKIFGDTLQNFSANGYRRVDRVAQLGHGVNPAAAIELLKKTLPLIPNVVSDPKPDVEIIDFTLAGPLLAVRPYCHTDHYWQVYFDTNRMIAETFGGAGYPVPSQQVVVRSADEGTVGAAHAAAAAAARS